MHTHTAPSGKTSLIDLVLVSNLEVLLNCSTLSPLEMMDVHSYHNYCVRLTLRWKHKLCKQVQKQARTLWRYAIAHFPKANQIIEEIHWDLLLPGYDANLAACCKLAQ